MKGDGAHAAAADSCATCHDPHQSAEPFQLTASMPELCLTCHDPDQNLTAIHLGADMATADDVSSATTRTDHRQGRCLQPARSTPPLRTPAPAAIWGRFRSWSRVGVRPSATPATLTWSAKFRTRRCPTQRLEFAECIDCHSPHASRQPNLLRASGGGVCLTCHEDQVGGPERVAHGAIDWFGCQSCHLPHGGSTPKLLRGVGNELCLGCHYDDEISRTDDGDLELRWGFVVPSHRAGDLRLIVLDPYPNPRPPGPQPSGGRCRRGEGPHPSREVFARRGDRLPVMSRPSQRGQPQPLCVWCGFQRRVMRRLPPALSAKENRCNDCRFWMILTLGGSCWLCLGYDRRPDRRRIGTRSISSFSG